MAIKQLLVAATFSNLVRSLSTFEAPLSTAGMLGYHGQIVIERGLRFLLFPFLPA